MAKTYNLTATLITGRTRNAEENWTSFDNENWSDWVNNKGYAGKDDPWYYATAMQFDSATLASLRSKTVTGITLEVNCTQAMTGESYIAYKYNNTWGGNSNSGAWARSVNGGSSASSGATANAYTIPAQTLSTGAQIFTLRTDTPYNGVPVYGLVAGPRLTVSGRWRFSSAILHVTTNETDYTYTLSYNANSGSGAPSSQSQTVTAGSTPSMTFTISNTRPTRTGYDFMGWSTSDSATTASYQPGGSITISANTTLYAVWKAQTYTVSYNANGGSGAPAAQTQNYPWHLQISMTTPTRPGHTFQGWSTSSTGTASYQPGDWYTSLVSVTLYAVWSIVTYTVSYNKGSYGTGTNTTDTKTYNVALTLKGAIFTRTGYTQDGWATSDGGATVYALSGSYTNNASVTLYPHWKGTTSTISTGNGTLGTAQTITVTRNDASYTHTITYKYGNATGTVGTGIGTSVSWTPPLSLASQFPSATSGTCTLTCTTYSGGTSIGTYSINITLSIPATVKCTVSSVAIAETVAGLNSKFGEFVQTKSKVSVTGTTSTADAYGATITAYTITINGQTLTSNGAITGLLQNSGTNSYSFTIRDTRGRTDTYNGTFNVVAYTAPSVSESSVRDSGTPTSIVVSYSWNISSVNSNNDKSIAIKYRKVGTPTYTTATTLTPGAYSGSGSYTITGTDIDYSYDILVQATDYFTTISTSSSVSSVGNRIIHISHTDQTIGFHDAPPNDGYDHQYFNERFHGVVDVVQRRCEATLSSAGWYRVCKITTIGRGDYSFAIDLNICRQFYYANNEQHGIKLIANWDSYSFVNENSKSNTQIITKVRYTRDGNDNGYIDIYYDSSLQNDVYCEFAAHGFYPERYTIESLQSVDPSPNGETVLTTYEFTANGIRTVTLTSAHSSVTINGQKVARSGQVVSLWVDFTVSAAISGYDYLINAPTFATAVNALVYDSWATVQTNVRLYADEGNSGLRCYGSFPAGRYIAFITYITTDV